ncbi:MAG: trypsin-like peptidase domain-containing protein [Thiothrix sp.]|uniref:trypsin-like peptidase domain-containing protein n=1 Tax=Thiothrix sp. TaxID=1032 RepID=UPI002602CB7C|nr:trypsin-like peptidase domain-containing protein [Thiothrix sp.]MDD5393066.1 trypsin-like peptidase domain-containing protein [Thiothrix sp.]
MQNKTVFLITSNDRDNKKFGTAFCVYKDDKYSYLVTCAHVVNDVGGKRNVKIADHVIDVIGIGESDSTQDVAILRVENSFNSTPIPLGVHNFQSDEFCTFGWYLFDKVNHYFEHEGLSGYLLKSIQLQHPKQREPTLGWKLSFKNDDFLKEGFSGSPVIDKKTRLAFAIITHRENNGQKGTAISIETLLEIWKDAPEDIIRKTAYNLIGLKKSIKERFQYENGKISKDFYSLLSHFNIEANDEAFLIALEILIDYCHMENKCSELQKYINEHTPQKRTIKFSMFSFFNKAKRENNKKCNCQIHFKTNLSVDEYKIPVQALASELNLCYETIDTKKVREGSLIIDLTLPSYSLDKLIALYEKRDNLIKDLGIEYISESLEDEFEIDNIKKIMLILMEHENIRWGIYDMYPNSIKDLPNDVTNYYIIEKVIDEARNSNSISNLLAYLSRKNKNLYEKNKPYHKIPRRPKVENINLKSTHSPFSLFLIFFKASGISTIGTMFLFLIQYLILMLLGSNPAASLLASLVWTALVPLGAKVGDFISESFNRNKDKKVAAFAVICYMLGYEIGIIISSAISIYIDMAASKDFFFILGVIFSVVFNSMDSIISLITLGIGAYYAYRNVRLG